MKKIQLLTTVLLFIFAGCETTQSTTSEPTATPQSQALTNTYWKLVELNGKALPANSTLDRKEIFMMLTDVGSKVVGNGGCNSFGGSFVPGSNGSNLTFSQLIRTKMACGALQLEDEFFKALESTNTYAIANNELHLIRDNNPPIAKFISIAGKTAN